MAPKKPSKKQTQNITPLVKKEDNGVNVLYVGSKESNHVCPQCGSTRRKGIVKEFKSVIYCSSNCVQAFKKQNVEVL